LNHKTIKFILALMRYEMLKCLCVIFVVAHAVLFISAGVGDPEKTMEVVLLDNQETAVLLPANLVALSALLSEMAEFEKSEKGENQLLQCTQEEINDLNALAKAIEKALNDLKYWDTILSKQNQNSITFGLYVNKRNEYQRALYICIENRTNFTPTLRLLNMLKCAHYLLFPEWVIKGLAERFARDFNRDITKIKEEVFRELEKLPEQLLQHVAQYINEDKIGTDSRCLSTPDLCAFIQRMHQLCTAHSCNPLFKQFLKAASCVLQKELKSYQGVSRCMNESGYCESLKTLPDYVLRQISAEIYYGLEGWGLEFVCTFVEKVYRLDIPIVYRASAGVLAVRLSNASEWVRCLKSKDYFKPLAALPADVLHDVFAQFNDNTLREVLVEEALAWQGFAHTQFSMKDFCAVLCHVHETGPEQLAEKLWSVFKAIVVSSSELMGFFKSSGYRSSLTQLPAEYVQEMVHDLLQNHPVAIVPHLYSSTNDILKKDPGSIQVTHSLWGPNLRQFFSLQRGLRSERLQADTLNKEWIGYIVKSLAHKGKKNIRVGNSVVFPDPFHRSRVAVIRTVAQKKLPAQYSKNTHAATQKHAPDVSEIYVYDSENFSYLLTLRMPKDQDPLVVHTVTWHPHEEGLLISHARAEDDDAYTVHIWDTKAAEKKGIRLAHTSKDEVMFHPKSSWMLTYNKHHVCIWDTKGNLLHDYLCDHEIVCVDWSPLNPDRVAYADKEFIWTADGDSNDSMSAELPNIHQLRWHPFYPDILLAKDPQSVHLIHFAPEYYGYGIHNPVDGQQVIEWSTEDPAQFSIYSKQKTAIMRIAQLEAHIKELDDTVTLEQMLWLYGILQKNVPLDAQYGSAMKATFSTMPEPFKQAVQQYACKHAVEEKKWESSVRKLPYLVSALITAFAGLSLAPKNILEFLQNAQAIG
jgi:hypothetical protein